MSSDAAAVIGLAPFLDVVVAAWRAAEPDRAIARVVARQQPDYTFPADCLAELPADARDVALAVDHRFLGFKRLELLALVHARGVRVVAVTGRFAAVATDARLGSGVYVGEGAVVGPGAELGDGACIGARAIVGPGARLARGAWLDPGAIVGAGATIGEQTAIGSGVIVADGAELGELCVLAVPGLVRGRVASKTYTHPNFPEPIRVLGG